MDLGVTSRTERDIESIYRAQANRLWRALSLATGNSDVASEAVAEAFAQVLRRGDAVTDPTAWVWRSAFRIAMGELKRRSRADEQLFELGQEMPETFVDLWNAMGELTRHQRVAVVLADYAGYSHEDIARILGSSTAAVGVHVHRARRRLRVLLEEHDG
jgi:RNA polymerase sigma-70 factor (ECF subfamily)